MWPESLPNSAVDSSSFPSSVALVEPEGNTPSFFLKDGRKIRVGDCALFKPPRDSPPFIGIIKKLTGDRDRLSLGVNWLYRPSDVKLVKGVSLEAAPNEVFYSFHKDEIPAGSLLHPCKVAFLSKGAELPSGISSFVCRRVYDTENKCLWWLTDKDYVKERQEEVDKLLNWTRVEMHGALHSGGRSPKLLNGPSSNSQIKTSADSVQNSGSLSSQVKGKKRERLDQVSDSSKRERLQKAEDGDSGQSRAADMLKPEIAKITDKGGLVHFDRVDKLVHLMKADSGDRKIDLAGRIMLINVISATDRSDCLGWFVQLGGLAVFDDWLQEVHKGKVGDGSNPKESDKSVEDYLFALLRALDKLPVDLHALQTCNIGKSVNHLRTHKNTEIQKRARSLVDTWKKRVEAEMNMIDTESGSNRGVSWPTKTASTQGSQVGIKKSGVSSDPGSRNSVVLPSATKGSQAKIGPVEGIGKLSAVSVSIKSSTVPVVNNSKDLTFRTSAGTGNPELLLTPIKEEQSSSSSQSQNCQSCSSDHAKTVGSCKEDARSSTTISVSKSSGAASRYEKTSNGISQMAVSGAQKEIGPINVVSPSRNSLEKSSPTGIPQEKSPDVPIVDNGPNQRLIVRLPNTGRSPCRGASGSCYEDPAQGSSKASPASKHENGGRRLRSRKEAPLHADGGMNKETGQGKDGLFVSDEAIVFTCNEKPKDVEVIEETTETLKGAGSLLAGVHPTEKSYDASLSSMNALVESCVKISEATASASADDDVGMNLLASVAAGEILRSGSTSSTASPQRLSALAEESCTMYCQTDGVAGGGGNGSPKNDQKVTTVCCDEMEECGSVLNVSPTKLQNSAELSSMRPEVRPVEGTSESSAKALALKDDRHIEVEGINCSNENGQTLDSSSKLRSSMLEDDRKIDDAIERVEESNMAAASSEPLSQDMDVSKEMKETKSQSFDVCVPKQHNTDKEFQTSVSTDNNPSPSAAVELDCKDGKSEDAGLLADKVLDKTKAELADDTDGGADTGDDKAKVSLGCSLSDHDSRCSDDKTAIGEVSRGSSLMHSSTVPLPENEVSVSCGHKLEGDESDSMKEVHATGAEPLVCNAGSGSSVKLDFDLNEGFPVDDVNQGESAKQVALGMSAVHLPCPLPISVPSMPGIFSTSITVAAAAKGSFVPPENPLRGKGELGWKGSAATSAFRPAEPRRISEMVVNASDVPAADAAVSQQSRTPLDFDLNVADERVSEDVSHVSARASCSESRFHDRASVGLDLDLNRVDDDSNAVPFSINKGFRIEGPEVPSWPSSTGGLSTVASTASRGFDLNNGPGIDEVADIASSSQPMRSSLAFPSTMTGIRLNGAEFRNFSSWFPPTNSFSAMTVPPVLSGRGEQNYTAAVGSQRILAPPTVSTSFGIEMCRPPVLPSSPAIPFSANTTLSYSGFPFETSFSPSSSFSTASTVYGNSTLGGQLCFPTIPSQFVGPSGVITSPYSRPFVMSLPGVAGGVGSDSRKWAGHIDLNSGPGGIDSERRDERLTSAVRQHPSSGLLLPDDHLKAYQFPVGVAGAGAGAGGVFKRKEPEGGWDLADRFSNKLSSSQ